VLIVEGKKITQTGRAAGEAGCGTTREPSLNLQLLPHVHEFGSHLFPILHLLMRTYLDTYRHQGLRKKLVSDLRDKGITDERVLDAINAIPRHYFLDTAFDEIAYQDRAFPIARDQTISQPYTVAYQTELLMVHPHEKILEIGTGSSYQSCVLAEMGARVFTIERQKPLFDLVKTFTFVSKYRTIKFFYGDGYEGLPTYAPFDKIIVTAAAPDVPGKLVDQLSIGGKMVIPVGEKGLQRMLRLTRKPDGHVDYEEFDNFSFVPMLGGKNG
jgi:protein-L-isoaspartate(D-aspartate) O-methyltransferase